MNLGLQHSLGQWTTDTNLASRGSMDHRVILRRPKLENERFFISGILSLLRTQARSWGWAMCLECKPQAAVHHLFGPTQQGRVPTTTAFSHTCHCLSPSLAHHHSVLHLSYLSIIYLCIVVALETAMCRTLYFFAPTALYANIHCSKSLD